MLENFLMNVACDVLLSISDKLLSISDKLSTRFDNESCVNLQLSESFSLYIVVLPLSCSFLIGTEKS